MITLNKVIFENQERKITYMLSGYKFDNNKICLMDKL